MNKNGRRKPLVLSASVIKCLLMMKLTVILICALSLQAVAFDGFGQSKVTLNMENASLKKVFKAIEKQTTFRFIYNDESLPSEQKVTIAVTDESVNEVVNKVLKSTTLGFRFVGNNLIVIASQQANDGQADRLLIDITGKVLGSSGEPLSGVSILEKGTTNGTSTRPDGTFSLSVSDKNALLVFSYVGYETMEIAAGNQKNINVSLNPKNNSQEAVVVVGYGSQRKKDATGAISSIRARDLNTVNAVSIDNLMQGKAAGVSVLQRSAQPGSGLRIVVRGALSPRGSNEPLYVIDGVPLTTVGAATSAKIGPGLENTIEGVDRSPLASINPNDIQSIDILKDASAAAIYGSAAANGVILITTKRGVSGKPTVSLSSSYSIQTNAKKIEVLNSQEFMKLSNIATKERYLFDQRMVPYGIKPVPASGWGVNYTDAEIAAGTTTYDHSDAIFRQGAIVDNNVSISGGNESTKYFSSFNFLDQKSLLRTTDFSRFSGRINLDQTFNSWLKLSISTLYSQTSSGNPSVGGSRININASRQTQAAIFFSPRLPLLQPDGSLTINDLPKTPNPAAWLYIKDQSVNKRLFVAPNLQIKINSDLTANVVAGYDNTTSGRESFSPSKAKFPEQTQNNYGGFSNNENNNTSVEGYLTYNKQIGTDHRITVVGGAGYYNANGTQYGLTVYNIPTDAVQNYNLSLAAQSDLNSFFSDKYARTKTSQFGRLNYVLKDKYFVGLTVRNDGSSAFPPSKKWGFFPAVSAAWNVSDENFLKNVSWVNNLKIRASYGATGNESFLTNRIYYVDQYEAIYGSSYYIGGQQNTGVIQTQLANPNLTWETDITANAGLDFGFFNGKLTGSFDVFQRTAKDLLDFGQLPFNSSITTIAQNVGSTRSRGFDLSLNGTLLETKNLSWIVNANVGRSYVSWVERNPNVALSPWIGANDGLFDIYGWKQTASSGL
jgi:TonB-linked SusC/RagA family outer membrane protein